MKIWRLCLIALSIASFSAAHSAKWSFDQRQILLVQSEGAEFPDELTTAQILDALKRKGRFRFVTYKQGVSAVAPLRVPADFAWSSSPSVRQLGLKYKADGILLLRKKGVRVELEWYAVNDGEPLFFEAQNLPDASADQQVQRKERIQKWVAEIWAKIPGDGYVIRRDLDSVYIEGAQELGLKIGDRIDLSRILRAQKHPVLKTIMKVETSQTGVAVVMEIAAPLSRAKIEYESPADPVESGDRFQFRNPPVVEVVPVAQAPQTAAGAMPSPPEGSEAPKEPRVAELSALGMIGSFSHKEKFNATTNYNMNGTAPGFEVQARGFLTREWLADFHYGMEYFQFTDVPPEYNDNAINASTMHWRLNGGYRIFFMEDVFPAGEFTVALGYSKYSLRLAKTESNQAPESKAYSGFEVGLRLQVPVVYRFAANLNVYKMLGASVSESPKSAGASSTNSVWQFQVGGKYLLSDFQDVFAGIRYTSLSSNFEGQGSRAVASDSLTVSNTAFLGGYTHKF